MTTDLRQRLDAARAAAAEAEAETRAAEAAVEAARTEHARARERWSRCAAVAEQLALKVAIAEALPQERADGWVITERSGYPRVGLTVTVIARTLVREPGFKRLRLMRIEEHVWIGRRGVGSEVWVAPARAATKAEIADLLAAGWQDVNGVLTPRSGGNDGP